MDHERLGRTAEDDDRHGSEIEFDRIRTSPIAGVPAAAGRAGAGRRSTACCSPARWRVGGQSSACPASRAARRSPRADRIRPSSRRIRRTRGRRRAGGSPRTGIEPADAPRPTEARPGRRNGRARPSAANDEAAVEPDAEASRQARRESKATEKPAPSRPRSPSPRRRRSRPRSPSRRPPPKPTEKPEAAPTAKPVLSLSLGQGGRDRHRVGRPASVDGADVLQGRALDRLDACAGRPATATSSIAAVEIGGATKAWDEHALRRARRPGYRVFCVRHSEDGYKVLAGDPGRSRSSPRRPEPTPKPTPSRNRPRCGSRPAPTRRPSSCSLGSLWQRRLQPLPGPPQDRRRRLRSSPRSATPGRRPTVDDGGRTGGTYHYLVQAKGHVGDDWVLLGIDRVGRP